MMRDFVRAIVGSMVVSVLLMAGTSLAGASGVAPGIPEPERRNVIVQLFNWRFKDIEAVIPRLKELGYSHVHVSPPQRSNETVWQWWGRYQPLDFSTIAGPLGSEQDFKDMNDVANAHDIKIIVDVVFNHTIDVNAQPDADFVLIQGDLIVQEKFLQFAPHHFHPRCKVDDSSVVNVRTCWLDNNLPDLKTEHDDVRDVAKQYLTKLTGLGADGFRFDAAKHIEPQFFPAVLSAVPGTFAFGEIIADSRDAFSDYLVIAEMDYYDFPLASAMREAFGFGGALTLLRHAKGASRALDGPRAITFVRNHDIDRGQHADRGIMDSGGRHRYGIGWDEGRKTLNRTDVRLAYAFIFGREGGLPYVFADMNTHSAEDQDDRFDDPFVVAGVRFHNLCLANPNGSGHRPEVWRIKTANVIGWQRGADRFIAINKAGDWYEINNLQTSLKSGEYKEVRTGWPMSVQPDGKILHWNLPPRSAVMFVWVSD